jgi:dihydrofolate reductase
LSIFGALVRRFGRNAIPSKEEAMRKVVLSTSISLDGFMGGPNGELDWLPLDPHGEHDRDALKLLEATETILVGASTAADMAAHWPRSDAPVAEPMNTIPKLVFSGSGASIEWSNAEVTSGALADEVERLKGDGEGHIVAFGGARFAQSLTRERLVDEYRLTVHPIVLGAGLPVFAGTERPIELELIETKTLAGGAVTHRYRRA